MKKVLLLLLVAFLAVATVPPLRERAAPTLDPAAELIAAQIEPAVVRIRDPIYAWSTRKELRRFTLDLQDRFTARLPLPHPRDFTFYLARNHSSDGFDRWGQPYYLTYVGDSVIVGSPGRDGIATTQDDIRDGFSRTSR